MLYTIFGISLLSPLALLIGSLSRTAVQASRGQVGSTAPPLTVTHRSAKLGEVAPVAPKPATAKTRPAHPRLGGHTRPAVNAVTRHTAPAMQAPKFQAPAAETNVVALPFLRNDEAELSRTA